MKKIYPIFLFLWISFSCDAQNLAFNHLIAENGLSQNSVFAITQDHKGFMWFGTRYGLNRYDGVGFKLFNSIKYDQKSLSDDYITALFSDSKGVLWVGTVNGVNRYDEKTESFERIYLRPKNSKASTFISNFYEDKDHHIWVNTDRGLFVLQEGSTATFIPVLTTVENFSLVQDQQHNFWLGTNNGLVKFRYINHQIQIINNYTNLIGQVNNQLAVKSIAQLGETLWLATESNGLLSFNTQTEKVSHYVKSADGLIHNSIRKVLKTSKNELFLATQEGLNIFNPQTQQFNTFQHQSSNNTSLNQNSIYSLYEDSSGAMWVGTYYGGVNVAFKNSTPFNSIEYSDFSNGINHNVISSIVEDDAEHLWIGTEGGGLNYYNLVTKKTNYYRNSIADPASLGSDFVKKIYKDQDGGIWVGTHGGGLNYLNKRTKRFKHFVIQQNIKSSRTEIVAILERKQSLFYVGTQTGLFAFKRVKDELQSVVLTGVWKVLENQNIKFLFEDSSHNFWVSTTKSIYKFKPNGGMDEYNPKNASNSLSKNSNYNNFIFEDSDKNIWIGLYYGGLMQLDQQKNEFANAYTVSNGLPNNNVLAILEDQDKNLWISTSKGLAKFNLKQERFFNYNVSDGLKANEFNYNSFYINKKGVIYFGGYRGLTYFNPKEIEINYKRSNIVFTNLYLDGKLVGINDEHHLLTTNLDHSSKLTLKSDQNIFTIEFALLNYIKSNKNKYAYRLKGINNTWVETTSPSATYVNLPSGTYKLFIKGANNDGVWSIEKSIEISILPPFYKTWWAILFYLMILTIVLFFVARYLFLRQLLKKEDELHQLKLNFFTNVSHEIRTHMTLLLAPIDQLISNSSFDKTQEKRIGSIKTSSNRLLRLVNELMDFRKAETNNLKLRIMSYDIIFMLKEIIISFEAYIAIKHIQIIFNHSADSIFLNFDRLQLEKVFFNIIINAYKFTPNQGIITINAFTENEKLIIAIEDNGRGIEEEFVAKLFNNFFQVEDYSTNNTGYGIGLALAKNIVELHNGSISVESRIATDLQAGFTKFTITLPLNQQANSITSNAQVQLQPEFYPYFIDYLPIDKELHIAMDVENAQSIKPIVLIVDDNIEIREVINDILKADYRTISAENGFEGLQVALDLIPDLIISDVMMPNMNGFTLCKSLKSDERTSHIPIVLLTAKDTEEDYVLGFSGGADQYMTKPFNAQLLKLNVNNLITLKENIRNKFTKRFLLEPGEIVLDSLDEKFIAKLIYVIESNLENEFFSVHLLAENVGMSTSVLYKKIKALTNVSVNDFIKSIRLKRAAQILKQKRYTVAEVAFMVGFADRKYFSKEFKKQFELSPREFIKENEADN